MSTSYQLVQWNTQKKIYDTTLWIFIVFYLSVFWIISFTVFPTITFENVLIRSFGTLAIIMLHIVLAIGPLARINKHWKLLLYNRRHFGVSLFIIASVHAWFSLWLFHGNGNMWMFMSLFLSNTNYGSLYYFPFQVLGFLAYLILLTMAFTSHDYWLNTLSPNFWKTLHYGVYLAYLLLIGHICLGVLELETSWIYFVLLFIGAITLITLHIWSGFIEMKKDHQNLSHQDDWLLVGNLDTIPEKQAKIVLVNNERVAIFKYNKTLSAVSNICKHQGGPIGEGKIVQGCITCPWHGYQYRPEDGCAPPPFKEKLSTYNLKFKDNLIYIYPKKNPEGTYVKPLEIDYPNIKAQEFYIGWKAKIPKNYFIFLKKISIIFLMLLIVLAGLLALKQKHIAPSYYSQLPKPKQGFLIQYPCAMFLELGNRDIYGNPNFKAYPLVNARKFGVGAIFESLKKQDHNQAPFVEITGNWMHRDSTYIIELSNGLNSVKTLHAPVLPKFLPMTIIDSSITLAGEIIDPKCYFGAMNPGQGKPHKSCAIRCISGGISPMFAYTISGTKQYALLYTENPEALFEDIKPYIGDPIKIQGNLYQFYNWKLFKINTSKIFRQ